jgi:hypothetical protein
MKNDKVDLHFIWLIVLFLILSFVWYEFAFAKDARTIRLNDKKVAMVFIHPGQSVILNFPVKPTKVIIGNKGLFSVEFVENDLAISALTSNAKSNLFVFLAQRRFAFDLSTTTKPGDSIILVRDERDNTIAPRFQ